MSHKMRFVLSLLLIMCISWADFHYTGIRMAKTAPVLLRQLLHTLALLATMTIGYANWRRYTEKWLLTLWLALYGVVVGLLCITLVLTLLHVPLGRGPLSVVAYLRNRFTWPLPFLFFYLLHLMSTYNTRKTARPVGN